MEEDMNISGSSHSQGLQPYQAQQHRGAKAGFSPEKAKTALNDLSNNFDTIDVDKDGSLSSSELETYAKNNGIEGAKNGPLDITREKLVELQAKIDEHLKNGAPPSRGPRPDGPPPKGGKGPEGGLSEEDSQDFYVSSSLNNKLGTSIYSKVSYGSSQNQYSTFVA